MNMQSLLLLLENRTNITYTYIFSPLYHQPSCEVTPCVCEYNAQHPMKDGEKLETLNFNVNNVRYLTRRAWRPSPKSSRRWNLGLLWHPRVTLVAQVGALGMWTCQRDCPSMRQSMGQKQPREGVHQRDWDASTWGVHPRLGHIGPKGHNGWQAHGFVWAHGPRRGTTVRLGAFIHEGPLHTQRIQQFAEVTFGVHIRGQGAQPRRTTRRVRSKSRFCGRLGQREASSLKEPSCSTWEDLCFLEVILWEELGRHSLGWV
jgi:hypothetical protein